MFCFATSSSYAADFTLNPDDNINDAINTINSGSDSSNTIKLNPGKYNKSGDIGNIINNKNIKIIGNGPKGSVIIDARKNGRMFNISRNSNITFINITFINGNVSFASEKGGAIYNSGNLHIINCDFSDNEAGNGDGGAIYNSDGNLQIENSQFINNFAINGGAIYSTSKQLNITNSNLTANNASNYGGAIHINTGSHNSIINKCIFTGNNALNKEGGALYTQGSNYVTVNNSKFTNNTAKGQGGGAIFNNGGDYFAVINSIFINNTAMGAYGGGAIVNAYRNDVNYSFVDYFKVVNCTFINNTAKYSQSGNPDVGGAITNVFGNYVYIINSTFINNTATDSYSGAIYNSAGDNFFVINCSFINNTAKNGGAITNTQGKNFTVINSTFINNTAEGHGGAIFHSDGSNSRIINSTFTNNSAKVGNGGAIFNHRGYLRVENSKFVDDYAGNYGGVIFNNGNMSLSKNIMEGSIASLGQEIYNNGTMGILNLTYLNNKTIKVKNNTHFIIYATLTDDMGNTVTGQIISFYLEGKFLGNNTSIEGLVEIDHLVDHGHGIVSIIGNYSGHEGFDIVTKGGRLLIGDNTTVSGKVDFDKDEYDINETVKVNVITKNNGFDKAYDVVVKVNLPKDLILNKKIVLSQGYYDFNTNTWYIGDLDIGEEATLTFLGFFTKEGTYDADIITSGTNFENSTDWDNTKVKEKIGPIPEPVPEPVDNNGNKTNENNKNNKTNKNNNYNTNTNETNDLIANATMKSTGISIIALILILISSLGFVTRRK